MNEILSFIRTQLDTAERDAYDVHSIDCAIHNSYPDSRIDCDCGVPDRLLRQVQAHRAILDEYVRVTQPGMKRPRYSGDAEEWFSGHDAGYLKALEFAIKTLVSIYSDRDGYDPAGRRDV